MSESGKKEWKDMTESEREKLIRYGSFSEIGRIGGVEALRQAREYAIRHAIWPTTEKGDKT